MWFCRSWTNAPPTSGGSTSQPSESGWAPVHHLGAYFVSIQMILTDSFLLILSSGEVVSYFLKSWRLRLILDARNFTDEIRALSFSFAVASSQRQATRGSVMVLTWRAILKRDVSERNADQKCAALLLHVTSRCWWSCTILHILLAWRIEFSVFY